MSRSPAERQREKAFLLSQIQQQRLDLSAGSRDWLAVTNAYDRGWNAFLSLRAWALVGSSILAVRAVRHPSRVIRWARRGLGILSAWKLVRSTLNQQQLRKYSTR